jgi:uncharacterized peroxidase-related enzyme
MSYLSFVKPEEATDVVADVYQQIQQTLGSVPSILQALSISPFYLKQHWEHLAHLMQNPNLSPALQACIRLTVSQTTQCAYCIDFNAGLLINAFGWTPEQVASLKQDPTQANLSDHEKLMLLFVLKAVKQSNSVTKADFEALKASGYTENDIFDALNAGARMLSGDIIANALHIERDF